MSIRGTVPKLALMVLAIVAGLVLTLAIPIGAWRTGRLPVAPLDLTRAGPAVEMSRRIWIDTDAACGASSKTDPDDCLAVALLANASAIDIVGVSTVFGNAELATVDPVTRELVDLLKAFGRRIGPVHTGSPVPAPSGGKEPATVARDALRSALAAGPLTILALGPLTNIAAALEGSPELQAKISRIVVVMGRRPGHIFHPAEGEAAGSFLGHGPVFRDFNWVKDREAAAKVLAMGLPLTLIPYDAGRQVTISGADLKLMTEAGGPIDWVAQRSTGWLNFWREDIGRPGFYPFDLLAAAYVLKPGLFDCADTTAWIGPDRLLWYSWLFAPNALLIGPKPVEQTDPAHRHGVVYCPQAAPEMHHWLISRLTEPG